MARLLALGPPPNPPSFHTAFAGASVPPIPWDRLLNSAVGISAAVPSAAMRGTAPGETPPPGPTQLAAAGGAGQLQGISTVAIIAIVLVAGALSIIVCAGALCKNGPAGRASEAAEARRQEAAAAAAARRQPRIGQKPQVGLSDSIRESFPTFVYSKAPLQPTTGAPAAPPTTDTAPPPATPALRVATRSGHTSEGAPQRAQEVAQHTGVVPGTEAGASPVTHHRDLDPGSKEGLHPEGVVLPKSFPAGAPQESPAPGPHASCQRPVCQVPGVAATQKDAEGESVAQCEGQLPVSLPPHEGALEVSAEDCCAVCLAEFEEGDVLLQLPCRHAFHAECVESWLQRHVTCPICRRLLQPPREDSQHGPAAQGQGPQQLAGAPAAELSGSSELAHLGTPGQEEEQRAPQTFVNIQGLNAHATRPQTQARPEGLLATAWHWILAQRSRNRPSAAVSDLEEQAVASMQTSALRV